MRLMLAALLFAHTGANAADTRHQPPRCADMQRLSDAANRAGSFQALFDEGFAPPLLFGCQPASNEGYSCWQNLTPSEVTPARYATIIRDCLPGATLSIGAEELRHRNAYYVRHGRLTARLSDSCTAMCRAGRIMGISFTIDPDRAAIDQDAD